MKRFFFSIACLTTCLHLAGQRSYFPINFKYPQIGQELHLNISFDLDKSGLRPETEILLDSLAKKLFLIDSFSFVLESHTDCRANNAYNAELSQRRADTIVSFIKRHAIRKLEIKAIGMGESKPLNDCTCEDKSKAHYTRYFEDTVNCIITPTVIEVFDSNTMQYKIITYAEAESKISKSEAFIPCREKHHQINRRTVLRITGKRRRYSN